MTVGVHRGRTVPKGWLRVEPAAAGEEDVARHGVVVYGAPLQEKDLLAFELVVLADAEGDRQAAAMVATELSEYAQAYLETMESDPELLDDAARNALKRCVPYRVLLQDPAGFTKAVATALAAVPDTAKA